MDGQNSCFEAVDDRKQRYLAVCIRAKETNILKLSVDVRRDNYLRLSEDGQMRLLFWCFAVCIRAKEKLMIVKQSVDAQDKIT